MPLIKGEFVNDFFAQRFKNKSTFLLMLVILDYTLKQHSECPGFYVSFK